MTPPGGVEALPPGALSVQHTHIFAILPVSDTRIPRMPTVTARHTLGNRQSLSEAAAHAAWVMPGWLQQMPATTPKFVQARWMLTYENDTNMGADPLRVIERGRHDVSKYIQFLRPLSRELRRRGLKVDGIYTDNEGGFSFFMGGPAMRRIYASAKARSKMPPSIRAIPVEKLSTDRPTFDPVAGTLWNRYARSLDIAAMRDIFIRSRLFDAVRSPGAAPTPPMVNNFNWLSPGWTTYDYNGWPDLYPTPIDGRSSNWGVYFPAAGIRYRNRAHHALWNVLVDQINYARAVLSVPGAAFFPTILQPDRHNHWLFEQMIAHFARTGVTWTASRSAYIYFNEWANIGPTSDAALLQIVGRHDEPFPLQPNLPELQMDCDRIETAGFVTTYEDFIANVLDPLTDASDLNPLPLPINSVRSRSVAA